MDLVWSGVKHSYDCVRWEIERMELEVVIGGGCMWQGNGAHRWWVSLEVG